MKNNSCLKLNLNEVLFKFNFFKIRNLIIVSMIIFYFHINYAANVELDHTFVDGGSSWGTDDLLKSKIELPEDKIPQIFRLPLNRPSPEVISIEGDISRKFLFIENKIKIYKNFNICYNEKLPFDQNEFKKAFDYFIKQIVGPNYKSFINYKLISTQINLTSTQFETLSNCDVFVDIGIANKFPFQYFPKNEEVITKLGSTIPQIVLGLFYQYNKTSLPVIVFHPDLQLSFSDQNSKYLEKSKNGKYIIDGRTLFFHELSHLMGFAHLNDTGYYQRSLGLNIMGINRYFRTDLDLALRYNGSVDLWKYWDLEQVSLYRTFLTRGSEYKIIYKNKTSTPYYCLQPGEVFHLRFESHGFSQIIESHPKIVLPDFKVTPNFPQWGEAYGTKNFWNYFLNENFNLKMFISFVDDHTVPMEIKDLPFKIDSIEYTPIKAHFGNLRPESFLLFSIKGIVNPDAKRQYRISGGIVLNQPQLVVGQLPSFRLEVQSNPANCYKNQ